MKPRIAIVGASSQVGSSVALYLHALEKAHVIAFSRSRWPAVFYELLGIEHRVLPDDVSTLRSEFGEVDGVVDFSYPHSEFWENRKILQQHLMGVVRAVRKGTPFISMSTQNAYGFTEADIFVRHRRVSWASPYCSLKRYGEQLVNRLGSECSVPTFNLRLGQVHGFLQRVSKQYSERIAAGSKLQVIGDASDRVNTLFVEDIGEVVLQIVTGKVNPATYSVLSQPQWSQEELYCYYQTWIGNTCPIEFIGHSSTTSWVRHVGHAIRWAERHRGFVDVAILQRWPWLAAKAKGIHRVRSFRGLQCRTDNAAERNVLGTPPLPILGSPNGRPHQVMEREQTMQVIWGRAIRNSQQATAKPIEVA